MPRKKWLLDRCGYPGQIVLSSKANYSFGRARDNDHVLLSLFVSRAHCIIKDDGTNLSVIDLNSANGTFVNEIRINANEAVTLKENDVIGFGVTNLLAENFYVYKLTRGPEDFPVYGNIKTEEEKKAKATVKQEVESDIEVITSKENSKQIEVIDLSDDDEKAYVSTSNNLSRFSGECSKTENVRSELDLEYGHNKCISEQTKVVNSEESKCTDDHRTSANTLNDVPPMCNTRLCSKVRKNRTEFKNGLEIEPFLIGDSVTESPQVTEASESRISLGDCVTKRIKLENVCDVSDKIHDFVSVSDKTISERKQSLSYPLTPSSNPEFPKLDIQCSNSRELTNCHEIPTCSNISDENENKSASKCEIKIEPGSSSRISESKELTGADRWFTDELLPFIHELESDTGSIPDKKDEKRKSTSTAIAEEPSPKKMKLCVNNVLSQKYPVADRLPIVLVEKLDEKQLSESNVSQNIMFLTEKMDVGKNIIKKDKSELDKENEDDNESCHSRVINYSQNDDGIILIDIDDEDEDEDENEMNEEPLLKENKVEDFFIKEEIFDDDVEEKDEEEEDDLVVQWASKLSQTFDDKLDNKEKSNSDDESIICFSKNKRNRLIFPDDSSDDDIDFEKLSVLNDKTSNICDDRVNKYNIDETDALSRKFEEILEQDICKNSGKDVHKSVLVPIIENIIDERSKRECKQDHSALLEPNLIVSEPNSTIPEPSSSLHEVNLTLPAQNSTLPEPSSTFAEPISQSYSLTFPKSKSSTAPANDGKDSALCSKTYFPSTSSSTESQVHSLLNTKSSLNKRTLLCPALPLKSRKHSKSAPYKSEKKRSSLTVSDCSRKQSNTLGDKDVSRNLRKINENPVLCSEHKVNSDKEKRKLKLKALAEKDKEKTRKNQGKLQSTKTSKSVKNTKFSRADKLAELLVSPHPYKESESLLKKTNHDEREKKSTYTSSEKSHKSCSTLSSKPSTSDKVSLLHSVEDGLLSDAQSETEVVQSIKKLSFKDLPKIPKLKVPTQIDTSSDTPQIHRSGGNKTQDKARAGPSRKLEPLHSILRSLNKSYKKKKVTFASEKSLCSQRIFHVELSKDVRRVDVKDIPAPRVDVQNARSLFEVSTNTLENIITKILRLWNPRWLQEQKEISKFGDIPPPCYGSKETVTSLVPMLTSFSNYKEYVTILQPLMLLDLWAIVSENTDRPTKRSRIKFFLSVDDLKKGNEITTLFCRMPLNAENEREQNFPRMGDMCHIYCSYQNSEQTSEHTMNKGKSDVRWTAFAYVDSAFKDHSQKRNNQYQGNSECASGNAMKYSNSGGSSNCVLKLKIKLKSGNHIPIQNQIVKLQVICNIRPSLRMFEAVAYLEHIKLSKMILQPQVEDYLLPDVSEDVKIWNEDTLDRGQKIAVLKATSVCLNPDPKICLIQGPPGTGKTKVILNIIMQILYANSELITQTGRKRPRILLCAPSNAGVDEIVERLLQVRAQMKQGERFKMVRCGQFDSMRESIRGVSLQELVNKDIERTLSSGQNLCLQSVQLEIVTQEAKKQTYLMMLEDAKAKGERTEMHQKRLQDTERKLFDLKFSQGSAKRTGAMEREAQKKILAHADIIATTLTSSFICSMFEVFASRYGKCAKFSCCIIDEATQCNEPECLIPLMYNIDKVVMVGDPEQLSATVLSRTARDKGFGQSLFNRIWSKFHSLPNNPVIFLSTQYRMHPEIYQWPNMYIYQGRVKSDPSISQNRPFKPYFVFSLSFHQTSGCSIFNEKEATFVSEIALSIERGFPDIIKTIGIITPYQKQLTTIKTFISKKPTKLSIIVNTIDGFQGQECDVIIFSCVRSQGVGFLGESQRLNVALTRARVSLIICGNFHSLKEDKMWSSLLSDAAQRGVMVHTGNKELTEDEILSYITKS